MFLLMSGTINFTKKYFLTPFWDSTKFSLFCKIRTYRFSVKNSIFPKSVSNVVEMFPLMSGTNYFAKKYFLTPFWDSTKFSLFCKVRACRFSATKIQFSKNCLKCWRNVSFDEWNKKFCQKIIFLPHFEIVQNFHYFVRSSPVYFLSKVQFSKNCLKCCSNVSFDEWNK